MVPSHIRLFVWNEADGEEEVFELTLGITLEEVMEGLHLSNWTEAEIEEMFK